MSARSVIDSIARGADKLIGENRRLRREVEKLEAARERLKEENRKLKEDGAKMERRLAVRDLAEGFGGGNGGRSNGGRSNGGGGNGGGNGSNGGGGHGGNGGGSHDNKVARARVNRLLREVDKCIELIGKEQ